MKKETKKKKKMIIAKVPKIAKFDLTFSKTEENIRVLTALESLKTNPGWMFLTQVFQGNIDFLARQIITKRSDEGKQLSDPEVDILRYKHAYLEELLKKPDEYAQKLTREAEEEDDLDPYQR